MKKKYLFRASLSFMVVLMLSLRSQATAQERDNLVGFDTTAYHPLYLKSADGRFKLNIGMYTQFRYNMNWRANLPDSLENFSRGYNLARTRIFFEGLYTPKLYYHFRVNVNSTNQFELFVAYLQWNIKKNMNLRLGRQFMALGREDWMYPQDLAAIEFSAHDFTYALWSSFGLQFHHTPSDYWRYWLSVGNGAYGGRRSFPTPNSSDLTFTGRMEWNIQGSNWGIWDDMLGRRGRDFGMLLGLGAGHLIRNDERTVQTDATSGTQLNLDYSISGNGFHFFAHGSMTSLKFDSSSELQDRRTEGFYTTLGYWLDEKFFAYGRFDYLSKGDRDDVTEDYASPGIGLSYYPFSWTNRIRLTLEYNHLNVPVNETVVEPDGQLGLVESDFGRQQSLRLQLQFGF